jgi:DNA repair protein RecN (Recombination protein N)
MLQQLVIENYLLVRHLSLIVSSGLTVLTGETGAGKSMVLGALDVLLGGRFPRDAVASGADRAVVEGVFSLARHPRAREHLISVGACGSEGEVRVRREISRQGRTRSWLNDDSVPQETVLRLREDLADFHGQREHQSLFRPQRQLEYLDAFAGCSGVAREVAELYALRAAQDRDLERSRAALSAHRKDRALLEYQLEEIERLGLKTGEEEGVEARLARLESAEKLAAEADRLLDLLTESDSSLVVQAGQAKNIVGGISRIDRELNEVMTELGDIAARLKDVAEQVRHYRESLSFDDAELVRLRERRTVLWELKRKHGLTVEQILARAAELKSLLEHGQVLEEQCRALETRLRETEARLVSRAADLSAQRNSAAPGFAERVIAAMHPLGFAEPRFEIELQTLSEPFDPKQIEAEGADTVNFLFSANPGLKVAPVAEVASGGESSRVTLAIKTVLSDEAEYPLIVYDEIDLGISGRVADQVGRALAQLARRHQVMVVTHLPQIASRADHQLAIEKIARGRSVETTARFLTEEERVQAIAALIAGAKVTDKSLASASELLRQSGKLKRVPDSRG